MEDKTPRAAESPTRTIDSVNSTAESVETIVDRNTNTTLNTQRILQNQSDAMANSTNTTNNKNSLTNSQISMISNDQKDSHIYTTPDLKPIGKIEKPVTVKELIGSIEQKLSAKPRIIEQQHQQQQQCSTSVKSNTTTTVKRTKFPVHIFLGVIQLVISISLVALGGLLLARGASLATTGSGIWSGAIAAISGSLGVINVKTTRTAFLAVSLICIASSTLAMALTGIGLVRDINRQEQEEDELNLQSIKSAISAASGLIFGLFLHFVVSILSVYQSALKLCSRHHPNNTQAQMLENVITAHNASLISQQKVEEYIKSIGLEPSGKIGPNQTNGRGEKVLTPEDCEKLMAMWLGNAKGNIQPTNKPGIPPPPPSRPIMLVPAAAGNGQPKMLPPGYRHPSAMMLPPGILPPGVMGVHHQHPMMPYPSLSLPPVPPGSTIHPHDLKALYRVHGTPRSGSEVSRRPQKPLRTGKKEASRRQRRRSESDAENKKVFTYTGMDRAIADSFLERQEQTQGSNVDNSSSSGSSRNGCPDVVM